MENLKKKVSYNKEFRLYTRTASVIRGFTVYPCTTATLFADAKGRGGVVVPALNSRQLLRNHPYLNKKYPNGRWYDPKFYSV